MGNHGSPLELSCMTASVDRRADGNTKERSVTCDASAAAASVCLGLPTDGSGASML